MLENKLVIATIIKKAITKYSIATPPLLQEGKHPL